MTADGDYEDLFRRAPFGYLATTIDGAITRVNDTLLGWLGRDQDAVVGRDVGELLDAGSRLFYETRHRPTLLLQTAVDEVALTLLRADGSPVAVLANSAVMIGDDGAATGVRIALLDASQRHQYERTLLEARRAAEASEARNRVLQTSTASFISASTELELAERLVDSAMDAFDAATSTVLLADGDGQLLTVAGTPRAPRPGGPARHAFDTREPVLVSSLEDAELRYPEFVEAMRDDRIDAVTVVPLLDGEIAIGVLVCTFGRARRFDDAAVDLKTALVLQASQVLVRLRLQAELRRMALHDPLTGLANRQLLHEHAERARLGAARSGRPLALVFFDLDGFKLVNDRRGHHTGDGVLREVADRLRHAVRAVDFAARFGGDEFVVICEDADLDAAGLIAERIRSAMAEPLETVADPVSASVGVAVLKGADAGGITTDDLLEKADAAMYASKNAGRNRVTVHVVP